MLNATRVIVLGADGQRAELAQDGCNGSSARIPVPVDKTLLYNALHFVTAEPNLRPNVVNLSARYVERESARRRLKVLVAEDNATNRKVVTEILKRAGHTVVSVGNGEEALNEIEAGGFDLVLMDLHMPVMGGVQAAKLLRLDPEFERLPVIALTADTTAQAIEQCRDAGFAGYVTKPIDRRRLFDAISEVAGRFCAPRDGGAERRGTTSGPDEADPAALPVLDEEALADLDEIGGGPAFFRELAALFTVEARELVHTLREAVSGNNVMTLRDAVHSLKGCAGNIGARRLQARCRMVEDLDRSSLEAQVGACLSALEIDVEETIAEVQRRLTKASDGDGAATAGKS
jgi:two-component system sensor histidine kinase RpfC